MSSSRFINLNQRLINGNQNALLLAGSMVWSKVDEHFSILNVDEPKMFTVWQISAIKVLCGPKRPHNT